MIADKSCSKIEEKDHQFYPEISKKRRRYLNFKTAVQAYAIVTH